MEYQKTIFTQKQGGEILGVIWAVYVEPGLVEPQLMFYDFKKVKIIAFYYVRTSRKW